MPLLERDEDAGGSSHRRFYFGELDRTGGPSPMSLIPCGLDGERHPGKNATLYWAWTRSDGHRKAYRQRLCVDCFRDRAVPLIAASEADVLVCPACHSSSVDDLDPIYLTYFMPNVPKGQAEMATCGACAAHVRLWAIEGAEELEDREASVGGLSPQPVSADAAWAALGLRP